jgi:hypothetical protein
MSVISEHRSVVPTDLSNFSFHLEISTASLDILSLSPPLRFQNCFLVPSLLAWRLASFRGEGVRWVRRRGKVDLHVYLHLTLRWLTDFQIRSLSTLPDWLTCWLIWLDDWLASCRTDFSFWQTDSLPHRLTLLTDSLPFSLICILLLLTSLTRGSFDGRCLLVGDINSASAWPHWLTAWLALSLAELIDWQSDSLSLWPNSLTDGVTRFLSGPTHWLTEWTAFSLAELTDWQWLAFSLSELADWQSDSLSLSPNSLTNGVTRCALDELTDWRTVSFLSDWPFLLNDWFAFCLADEFVRLTRFMSGLLIWQMDSLSLSLTDLTNWLAWSLVDGCGPVTHFLSGRLLSSQKVLWPIKLFNWLCVCVCVCVRV